MRRSIEEVMMRLSELEQNRWINQGTNASMLQREPTAADYEMILGERDQKLLNLIDNQGRDIAMDFTQLDKKV